MARKISISNLNATTIDILNTIRANATAEYQSLVPEVTDPAEVRKVGEIIYGYPALANQFLNALVTRIAFVNIKSATFNNAYADLKKGYLEFGETVEEVFVQIAKAREFSAEKANAREFQRSIPDVRTAFHTMNYRVQYPVTIQDEDLRTAFISVEGVTDLIAKIVDSVKTASEYDEYLLFKYVMIKAITKGQAYPVAVGSTEKDTAVAFRSISNKLTFMSKDFNASGVTTTTPKSEQEIFMDSTFNAQFDVNVLASAFNMDKADFIGRLRLVDSWDTFDNERFDVIRQANDSIEEVTADELAIMSNVVGVLADREWFQFYDNQLRMTEKYVASGEYWNYFLNVWKTVSSSPFSNFVVFVKSDIPALPAEIEVEITGKVTGDEGTAITLGYDTESIIGNNGYFVQTSYDTEHLIGVQKYGAILIPPNQPNCEIALNINGTVYTAEAKILTTVAVGTRIVLSKS